MRLAITGGAAEGKSTILSFLKDMGARTVSADECALAVFSRAEIQAAIAEQLEMALPLDRSDLRRRISTDDSARKKLNSVTHPAIWQEILRSGAQAVEVPLLFEAGLAWRFDRIWVATCGKDEQLRRLTKRLGSIELAQAQAASQLPTQLKIHFADCVIRTNEPFSNVLEAVTNQASVDLQTN